MLPGSDKVVLITGAAQGLGAASARLLAERGCILSLADINGDAVRGVASACAAHGAKSTTAIVCDLSAQGAAEAMITDTVRALGRLDVVIQCAAAAPAEAFLDMTEKAWDTALAVNVRAVALTMAAAGRAMTRTGGGRIINITSAAARMGLPNYATYAATKAAVDSLTRSGAVALAMHNITVNSLSPGMMDTPLQVHTEEIFCRLEGRNDLDQFKRERTARIPLGRRSDPDEMAKSVVWLALDAPAYMTAERLNVTGGLDKD